MAFEQKEGGGSLFRNDYKTPGDSKPDYKGSALINGVEMDIAGWIKEGMAGKKSFLSLAIKPKGERSTAPTSAPANDEGLPF